MLAALLISAIVTTNSPDTAVTVRTQVRERLEEMRAVHEQNRQEVQARVQESREDWEQEREQFHQRLELIRDEYKQAVTQALQERIENTHRRWVEHWSIVLDRLSQILDKAEARDGSEQVASLIAAARTKIATAQNLLEAQADNVYVVEIDGDENLGENVSSTISEMHTDMQAVREAISTAREAVGEVINALN